MYDALKLSVTIFIGLFFFAILTLSFDYLGFIRLPEFGSLARPALILDGASIRVFIRRGSRPSNL
jgi:hypothetical protein